MSACRPLVWRTPEWQRGYRRARMSARLTEMQTDALAAESAKTDFAAKVAELIKQARAFGPDVRAKVTELLQEARKSVITDISNVDPQSFQAAQLRTLARSIDGALRQFGRDFSQYVNSAQSDSWNLGVIGIDQPFDAAGLPAPSFAGVSTSALSI